MVDRLTSRGIIRRTARWYSGVDDQSADVPPVTRLWFSTGNPPGPRWPSTPADASWESDGSQTAPAALLTAKVAQGSLASAVGGTGVANDDSMARYFYSPPLDGAQALRGSARAMLIAREFAAADDYRTQIVIRVVSNNGSVVRGTLYAGDVGALVTELDSTASTARRFPQAADAILASVAALDGDRILVEIGVRQHSATVTNATISFNDPSTADIAPGDETATTGASWIEFTGIIKFRAELTADWMYDQQAFVANGPRWYQPDTDDIDGPLPPPVVAVFDPATGFPWQEQPTDPATRWGVQTETESLTPIPNLTVATVAQDAGLWQEQPGQERSLAQTWFQPADATEVVYPTLPAPVFDPSLMDFGRDAQMDRSIQPTWFRPDDPMLGMPTGAQTTATVAQQAGLWQDSSPQQDRSIQPTWYQPPDATEPIYPSIPVPPFLPANGFPWLLADEYPWRRDFSPDMVEAHFAGPLQSWLFTTGAPAAPGSPPPVLIDATSGAVFVSIGGPFIVPAS